MMLEWWHWIVAGLGFVLLELAIPAFFVIWFGLGAIIVGLVLGVMPGLSMTAQVGLWVLASTAMVLLWFRVLRRARSRTRAGTADGDVIGEIGLLTAAVEPFQPGRVRFQRPVLGTDQWPCHAECAIAAGERVRVVAVEGSFVKVAKL